VVDGLAAEVLQEWLSRDPEAPGVTEFALSTSVAEEFTVELATRLTDDPSIESHLEQWASSGLLLADRRARESFYRWPGAARRMFQGELRRRQPDRLADLHGRLASALADEHPAIAVSHAVQAGDWPLVVRIVDVAWRPLLIGHRRTLYDAVIAAPLSEVRTSRRAMAMRDVLLQVPTEAMLSTDVLPASGDELDALSRSDDARDLLHTALAVLVAFRNCAPADVAREMAVRLLRFARTARTCHPADVAELYPGVLGQVGAALIAAHDLTRAIDPIREQYRRAAESTSDYLARDAAGKLALIHALDGDLRRTAQWLDRFEAAPTSSSWLGVYPAPAAECAHLLGDLDRLQIDKAARFGARIVLPEFHEPARGLYLYARALLALHDGTAANLLDELEELSSEQRTYIVPAAAELALHAAAKSDLLIALGRGNLARAILDGDNHEHVALRVGQARLALLTGDDAAALRLTADAAWERQATIRARQEMRLVRAVAAHRLGEQEIAHHALHQAADAARATGALRPFVTVPRGPLLELAQSVPAAGQVLSDPAIADHPPVFPQRLSLTTLTQREQLVLVRLAAGLNLQQTADALFVSYNTVRSQQASAYRKLGVDSRSDAIARAREWGLL
jgi:LuxR family maltose regulon positive regulatory protein